MRIAVASDHRGFDLKKKVLKVITEAGHMYKDFGCYNTDSVDYPDFANKVAKAVAVGHFERGILICGTGIGMCIAANKVKGIRAAQCHNVFSASRARQHNDANICCLAAEGSQSHMSSIINAFLNTEFEGGRHQKRVEKIKEIEKRQSCD